MTMVPLTRRANGIQAFNRIHLAGYRPDHDVGQMIIVAVDGFCEKAAALYS
jgi:hypothetical protein